MTKNDYTIADYLFDRIAEAGASEIFGVPGDYNLSFLDNIIDAKNLRWIGNTNELNAGYAADGYARERGFAAFVTTFGVGELSAINATAGSFAEYVPVLHIVGAPATALQDTKKPLHHSLGDGMFNHFMKMVEPVTVARANITPRNAASEIDRVINMILRKQRPGYLMLPPDVAKMPIYPPTTPLDYSQKNITSQIALDKFKEALSQFIEGKTTTLLADLIIHRTGLQPHLKAMLAETDIPYATLSWGKTLIDEQSNRWAGVYAGLASRDIVKDAVENCECLIQLGVDYTDGTTAGFSHDIDTAHVVDIHYERATVGDEVFAPIAIEDGLQALHQVLTSGIEIKAKPLIGQVGVHEQQGKDDEPLLQKDIWQIIGDKLDAQNIVFADQGTSFYGITDVRLPAGVTLYGQPMWGSIGYTLPACLGAAIASPDKRSALLIGDGSALLTIQDLSIMLREQTNTAIILINNDGYTIERAIHGENQPYNDIPKCDWQVIPKAFGATEDNCLVLKATTPAELKDAITTMDITRDKVIFLEVIVGKHDVPPLLKELAEAFKPSKA